jgi:hypothetical protein
MRNGNCRKLHYHASCVLIASFAICPLPLYRLSNKCATANPGGALLFVEGQMRRGAFVLFARVV